MKDSSGTYYSHGCYVACAPSSSFRPFDTIHPSLSLSLLTLPLPDIGQYVLLPPPPSISITLGVNCFCLPCPCLRQKKFNQCSIYILSIGRMFQPLAV